MTSRRWVLFAALVLAMAACGGGEDAGDGVASLEAGAEADQSAADAEAVEDVDTEALLLEFSQCMRDQGVDIGDPTVDADGNVQLGAFIRSQTQDGEGPPEGLPEAFEECGEIIEGAQLGFRQGDVTELQDTLLEFAACMRDQGIDVQDPDFSTFGQEGEDGARPTPGSGTGPGRAIFGSLDLEDPAVQAAQEACSDILGGFGPGGGPGGGPTGEEG